ncbi:MAG TPA: hypothetical protein VMS37_08045 [Verrucomicrobiae bacterium]|nr:hypothetical protein [Verrucomicrobiae bacterium]
MRKRAAVVCVISVFAVRAAERPGEWTGNYPPCDRSADVLKPQRMDLGVRFSTSTPGLAAAFARAMDLGSSSRKGV